MAVTPGYVSTNNITWSASTTATVSSASIGTASPDRVVVVAVTVEETATIDSCTIGGVAAKVGISVRNTTGTPDNACAIFYQSIPTGTTANIVVTLSASSSQTGRVSVWAMTGAYPQISDSNSAQGSGATQTLGGVTIPTNGAGFWVFNNATTGTAVTWTNATERDDSANSGATYRHSVADSTTAGTPTVTADGATANQILAGIAFEQLPAVGWDTLPQMEKALFTSRKAVALALAAGGMAVWCPQPVVQLATGPQTLPSKAEVTSGRRGTRTLYYQAYARPPGAIAAAPSNLTTSIEWLRPFDRAVPPRRPAKTYLTVPPQTPAAAPAVVTVDTWVQPLSKAVPRRPVVKTTAGYPYPPDVFVRGMASVTTARAGSRTLFYQSKIEPVQPPAAAVVVVATIEWVPPLSTMPPSRFVVRPFGQFTPPQIAQVTPDEWLQPFQRQVPGPFPVHTQPVFAYQPAAAPTVDEWLTPFTRAAVRPAVDNALHTPFVPEEATIENTIPGGGWLVKWQGPPRVLQQLTSGSVYAYTAPFVDNTTTIDKWKLDWNLAAKATKPIHTQPFYGFPYEGVDNTRNEWDWYIQWKEPPRYWPLGKPYQPFVPKEATLENTQTPDKWLQAFRGPPRYWPVKLHAQPFVPKEATLENTVSVDQYLFRFQKAVPGRPVRHTQPFYGFPYEAASNLTTSIEWLRQWQGPPRYTPLKSYPYQPFVPKEAVLENTGTVATWLRDFGRAAPRRPVVKTQLAWSYEPIVTVTFGGWHQPLGRAARRTRVPVVQVGWSYPPPTADNTVTIDKWQQRFVRQVYARPVTATQPVLIRVPSLEFAVEYLGESIVSRMPWRRSLFYQARVEPPVFLGRAVHITTGITVEFTRMLRYSCKAEADDGAVEQAEQSDPWATVAEQTVNFVDESEQADPWGTQDEVADTSVEEEEEPGSSCP